MGTIKINNSQTVKLLLEDLRIIMNEVAKHEKWVKTGRKGNDVYVRPTSEFYVDFPIELIERIFVNIKQMVSDGEFTSSFVNIEDDNKDKWYSTGPTTDLLTLSETAKIINTNHYVSIMFDKHLTEDDEVSTNDIKTIHLTYHEPCDCGSIDNAWESATLYYRAHPIAITRGDVAVYVFENYYNLGTLLKHLDNKK